MLHTLTREIEVPRSLQEVFTFFADAENLESITPPWLQFRITSPTPIDMKLGTTIDYRLRLRGIPIRWRSRISVWQPPHKFVDEQLRGPYRKWVHEHTFATVAGGTMVRDVVRYAVVGIPLVHRFFVRPDLERIFDYRSERLRALLG